MNGKERPLTCALGMNFDLVEGNYVNRNGTLQNCSSLVYSIVHCINLGSGNYKLSHTKKSFLL